MAAPPSAAAPVTVVRRSRVVAVLLLSFISLGLFIGIGYAVVARYLTVEEVEVPNLIGRDADEALRELRALELTVRPYVFNVAGARVGSVTAQSPEPGTWVRRGRTISVGVHNPPASVQVPNLVGLTEEQALRTLRETNLLLGEVSYEFSTIPSGRVLSQRPGSGVTVTGGSSISLVVSRGAEVAEITLPDVVGLNLTEARARLEAAGVRRIEAVATSLSYTQPGQVSAQLPPAGQRVPVSAVVTLFHSLSGREVVRVPEVQGLSLQRAQLMLRAAGLEVAWVDYIDDADKPPGVVEVRPSGYTLPGTPMAVTVNGAAAGENVLLPTDRPSEPAPPTAPVAQPPAPPPTPAGRTVPINFNPSDYGFLRGQEYRFELVVLDDHGQRTVIDRVVPPDRSVNTSVQVQGQAEIQISINGQLFTAWSP